MSDVPIQHAFVSYVREDADAVDQLVSVLQAASIPVWKDTENLWPGEDWQQKIREAIEDGSLAFIACFSTSSVQKAKTYMNAELNLAVEQIRLMRPGRVWLLPVRLDDCELPHFDLGGSRTLDSLQRIDLFGPKREANLARLVAAVMAIFGTSTTTPSARIMASDLAVRAYALSRELFGFAADRTSDEPADMMPYRPGGMSEEQWQREWNEHTRRLLAYSTETRNRYDTRFRVRALTAFNDAVEVGLEKGEHRMWVENPTNTLGIKKAAEIMGTIAHSAQQRS